jgi:hypothetical protein
MQVLPHRPLLPSFVRHWALASTSNLTKWQFPLGGETRGITGSCMPSCRPVEFSTIPHHCRISSRCPPFYTVLGLEVPHGLLLLLTLCLYPWYSLFADHHWMLQVHHATLRPKGEGFNTEKRFEVQCPVGDIENCYFTLQLPSDIHKRY